MKKKMITALLASAMVLSLVACDLGLNNNGGGDYILQRKRYFFLIRQ